MAKNKAIKQAEKDLYKAHLQARPELLSFNQLSKPDLTGLEVKDAAGNKVTDGKGNEIKLANWLSEGTTLDGFRKYVANKTKQEFDLRKAIEDGTGVSNALQATAGKFLQSFGFEANWADEKIEAKHILSMVTLMLRAGFAKNPRLAIAEWERIAKITPNAEEVFSSPKAFLNQLQTLRKELNDIFIDINQQILNETQGANDKTRIRELQTAKYMLIQPMRMLSGLDSNPINRGTSASFEALRARQTGS
jgi:hypothetical protein